MASDPQSIFYGLKSSSRKPSIAEPDSSLDKLVEDIFRQAQNHRDLLVKFYIWYTVVLSGFVLSLIFWQAALRCFVAGKQSIELIPEKALYLVIIGMFGQFIGLLTIVTKKVWEFKSFFDHANKDKTKS